MNKLLQFTNKKWYIGFCIYVILGAYYMHVFVNTPLGRNSHVGLGNIILFFLNIPARNVVYDSPLDFFLLYIPLILSLVYYKAHKPIIWIHISKIAILLLYFNIHLAVATIRYNQEVYPTEKCWQEDLTRRES
ncbi:MAG: hypothetical protein HYZ42_05205, partial [Bacteroidetes bacterium]|nr:hypothetical protein [Bacteroidota bacterium]